MRQFSLCLIAASVDAARVLPPEYWNENTHYNETDPTIDGPGYHIPESVIYVNQDGMVANVTVYSMNGEFMYDNLSFSMEKAMAG